MNQLQSKQVSTEKPWLLVLMIDSSHSMQADWGASRKSMSIIVEEAINQLLYDMALNYIVDDSTKEDQSTKDRIHLKIIIYSGEDTHDPLMSESNHAYSLASGPGGWVGNYETLYQYSDENNTLEIPRWVKLEPSGKTPMLLAFQTAKNSVKKHIEDYPSSFPPVVLNISDGEPTDCGDPVNWEMLKNEAEEIKSFGEEGQNPLICNIHLDPLGRSPPSTYSHKPPVLGKVEAGLWHLSSIIPDYMIDQIPILKDNNRKGSERLFVFNSNIVHFHEFLDFATRRNTLNISKKPICTVDIEKSSEYIDVEFSEEE